MAVGTVVACRGKVERWNGNTALSTGTDGLVCNPLMPAAERVGVTGGRREPA